MMADSILPSVAMLYAWGLKDRSDGVLLELANLNCAKL